MRWNKTAKIIARQKAQPETESYPLPEGKPETRNCFGTMKRWNSSTGKYDLPV